MYPPQVEAAVGERLSQQPVARASETVVQKGRAMVSAMVKVKAKDEEWAMQTATPKSLPMTASVERAFV